MPVVIDWSGWDVSKTEPPLTDGNLALDVEPMVEVAAPLSPISGDTSTEPVERKEPGRSEPEIKRGERETIFPLKARRFKRMDARTLASIVAAFKESCRRCGVVYNIEEDKQGRPRVVLSGRQGGLALWGLETKLEQEPQLEATLLLELAKKDAALQELLDERAAIRAADGLSDDDMTVALLMIGVDERDKRGRGVDCVMAIVNELLE